MFTFLYSVYTQPNEARRGKQHSKVIKSCLLCPKKMQSKMAIVADISTWNNYGRQPLMVSLILDDWLGSVFLFDMI